MNYCIRNQEDLKGLFSSSKPIAHITVKLPSTISLSQQKKWEKELNEYYPARGNRVGLLAILFAVGGMLVTGSESEELPVGDHLTFLLGIILGSALLGKIAGRIYARIQLRRIVKQIHEAITPEPMHVPVFPFLGHTQDLDTQTAT